MVRDGCYRAMYRIRITNNYKNEQMLSNLFAFSFTSMV